jgi:hypothetical protein
MTASTPEAEPGLFVLVEDPGLEDAERPDVHVPAVRGVFHSLAEVERAAVKLLVDRGAAFDRGGNLVEFDPKEHSLEFADIVPRVAGAEEDEDAFATQGIWANLKDGGPPDELGLYVWQSNKRRKAADVLKLFWCTTPEHKDALHLVARNRQQAFHMYAMDAKCDEDDIAIEFLGLLPDELQEKGDALLGPASIDLLKASGLEFLRDARDRSN